MDKLQYTAKPSATRAGYVEVFNPMGDGAAELWQDDFDVIWMMYQNSLQVHGEARANDLMFGFLLGHTHTLLFQARYPKVEVTQDGVGTTRVKMTPAPAEPPAAGGLISSPSAPISPPPPPPPAPARGVTSDRSDPGLNEIVPGGQQAKYLVLSEEERAQGFVRPVRRKYRHIVCGSVTTMGKAIAETYARDPHFYGGTFCCNCGKHFLLHIGDAPQFIWHGESGEGSAVGS